MGYFGNALDRCPTFHLQDYLQSDFPILSRTICFYLVSVVLGVLVPIAGSTWLSFPSVMSRKSNLNPSHCTTTIPALWVALISPLLLVTGCCNYDLFGVAGLGWEMSLNVPQVMGIISSPMPSAWYEMIDSKRIWTILVLHVRTLIGLTGST